MNPIFQNFLNSNNLKKELEKIKRIQYEVVGISQKTEKKPKRKAVNKTKSEKKPASADVINNFAIGEKDSKTTEIF